MTPARAPGKIILVHGASSSGKTTLCRALQARLDAPFRHYSIDHFRGSGVLPTERFRAHAGGGRRRRQVPAPPSGSGGEVERTAGRAVRRTRGSVAQDPVTNPDSPQATLFDFPRDHPAGLVYQPEFLSTEEERALVAAIEPLPLREAIFREYTAKRRVVHFHEGADAPRYDDGSADMVASGPLPAFLVSLRERVARRLDLPPQDFVHALVSEYRPGTPIGWHRDKPVYGIVVGLSLNGWGRMRFRPYAARDDRHTIALDLAPRSLYVMRGAIRWEWQHRLLPTRELRYSITLRTRARR